MTLACIVLLVALFSLLKYSELHEKMALITRTVSLSFDNLAYFMALACIVFSVLAVVGHVLFGSELGEWSHLSSAMNTEWALVLGNYDLNQLEAAAHDSGQKVVISIYYYACIGLMLLLLMNMLIALLMDGYTSARQTAKSSVEQGLRFNVGPLMPLVQLGIRRDFDLAVYWTRHWLHSAGLHSRHPDQDVKPWQKWTDERWIVLLTQAMGRVKRKMDNVAACRVGVLVQEITEITDARHSEVIKQVYCQFQSRSFKRPAHPDRPFDEASVDQNVKQLMRIAQSLDVRSRAMLKLNVGMHEYLTVS